MDTVKLIAEVGLPIVTSAIFLVLAFRMFMKHQEWLEDFIKKDRKVESSHPNNEESKNLSVINKKIYQEAKGLLNALNADRAYVVLYHNGGKSSSGLYFQKMSCICEVVHSGISPMGETFQNVHRSSYSYMIDKLDSNTEILKDNIDSIKSADSFSYSQLVNRHTYSIYIRALKDIDGNQIGFIGIDYCSKNEKINKDSISSLLHTVSNKISSLVDIRDEVE